MSKHERYETDHRPTVGDEGVWDPYPFRLPEYQPPLRGQRVVVTELRPDMYPNVPVVGIRWPDGRISGALVTDIHWDSVGSLAKPEGTNLPRRFPAEPTPGGEQ